MILLQLGGRYIEGRLASGQANNCLLTEQAPITKTKATARGGKREGEGEEGREGEGKGEERRGEGRKGEERTFSPWTPFSPHLSLYLSMYTCTHSSCLLTVLF